MPIDRVTISNQALAGIGISQIIHAMDEPSSEAIACNLFMDTAIEFVLRDMDWNCARRYVPLSLDSSPVLTGLMWRYKYVYPSDCVMARAIIPPTLRFPRSDQRIPFEVSNEIIGGGDKLVIYTDQIEAVLRYTKRITNVMLFDAQLSTGISYLLSSLIAMPLSVKPVMAKQARDAYAALISHASTSDLKERQEGEEPEPAVIATRNA